MSTLRLLLGAVLLVFCLGPVLAQEPAKDEQTPAVAQPAEEVQVPESYVERTRKAGAVLELSMKDAIRLALTNNLEIAIQDFNEDLNRERIISTKGFYDPRIRFTIGYAARESPSTTILDAGQGIDVTTSNNFAFGTTIEQNVPGGGVFTLGFENQRAASNRIFSTINPSFGSNLSLDFVQPLWRGFRETRTEHDLKIVNLDSKISDSEFQDTVSRIVQQVQNQYWDLVFAIENHETARQSMELAIVQHRNNQKRVEIGVMAPIEITKSRAAVAVREQEMIRSEVQIIEAQNGLKRMLAPDPNAAIWSLNILPTDQPQERQITITMDEAIARALERRPELEQIRLEMQKNEVDRKFAKNTSRPQFNLRANVVSNSTAGRVLTRSLVDEDGDGIPETPSGDFIPVPDAPFYGNFGKSIPSVFGFDYVNYGVYLDVEMPLWRDRTNDATLAQIAINERRLNSQLKNMQQMVMVDVRNAYEGMLTQKKALDAARVSRQLAEEQLAGENKRFEAGLSTNFEVLQYQNDLADARVREIQALINFEKAVTALQRSMYTIIDDQDIVIAKRQNGEQSRR
ncbi:MAG TPA: TolC family protein [Acidobacteriota bacterium]|mgnify:CR=1 FL=1|nr:TolC family protein [Acidobacteriota bacterium]